MPDKVVRLKVLSYNLYWWHLFDKNKGIHKNVKDSAAKLIANSSDPAYDVMGFQECEDPVRLLEPVGLLSSYETFLGKHAICMAYRKNVWSLLARGEEDVAEDMLTEYYGTRGAQWMRLRHADTGATLLFVNHHGPLHVNSGGACGGVATAHKLLSLIAEKGERGDIIVLVGDFNANAASKTVQELWRHLVLLYNGDSFGGVDNIFANLNATSILSGMDVGSGGSDHNAISILVELRPTASVQETSSNRSVVEPGKAIRNSSDSPCGLLEPDVEYIFAPGSSWATHADSVTDPRDCCWRCQHQPQCTAWVLSEWVDSASGPRCFLKGGEVVGKTPRLGLISGLPPRAGTQLAWSAADRAISGFAFARDPPQAAVAVRPANPAGQIPAVAGRPWDHGNGPR